MRNDLHLRQPTKKRDWSKIDIKSYRGQKTIALYNKFRMQNELNTITYDQMTELAQTFRPDAHTGLAVNKVKNFLKNPEVKQIADNDLRLALQKNDINPDYVITTRKQIINKAIEAKQFNAVNVALDRLEDHLGLNQKTTITETRQINSNLEDNYNKAKQTQTITISKNIDNEGITRENTSPDSENSVKTKDDNKKVSDNE